jgi:hypothetical protein
MKYAYDKKKKSKIKALTKLCIFVLSILDTTPVTLPTVEG